MLVYVEPIDYGTFLCTYATPEIASCLTEKQAKEKRIRIKIGKFPFSASGKNKASGTQMKSQK
jgi:dihydrolipoamide dehydrogenase